MMKWIRIAWAAIQRHKIEVPIRSMWREYVSDRTPVRQRKLMNRQFSAVVDTLASKDLIDMEDASFIQKEYNRLSKILHGATP